MSRRLLAGALGLGLGALFAAPPAQAQAQAQAQAGLFEAWDVDGNGVITRDEFRLGMGTLGVYRRWDSDHDGTLSDEEYRPDPPAALEDRRADFWNAWNLDGADLEDAAGTRRGFYDAYDRDGDGRLDADEWRGFEADAAGRGWLER